MTKTPRPTPTISRGLSTRSFKERNDLREWKPGAEDTAKKRKLTSSQRSQCPLHADGPKGIDLGQDEGQWGKSKLAYN